MNAAKKTLDDREFACRLNDCYPDVDICGLTMCQGDILFECDPIAFREAKNNYEDSDAVPWVCSICDSEYYSGDEAEECCKIDRLCELLAQLGYYGIDISLKESLIVYGIVCKQSSRDQNGYYCIYSIDDGERFDHASVSLDDVQSAIDGMPDGFFDFIGTERSDYTIDRVSIPLVLHYIKQYNGVLTDTLDYECTIDDIITMLESEVKANDTN